MTSNKVKDGQSIKIRYAPDNPEHKYVKGHDGGGIMLPVLMIFGIILDAFILVIFFGIIRMLKEKLSEKKAEVTV